MKVLRTALTHKVLGGNTLRTRADSARGSHEQWHSGVSASQRGVLCHSHHTRIRTLEHCSANRRPPHEQTWPTLQMLETRVRNEVEVAARE